MLRRFIFNAFYFVIVAVIVTSCSNVWVPDPIDPRLPKYTEKGYNSAGALINGQLWKSEVKSGFNYVTDQPDIYYSSFNDSLVIVLHGEMNSITHDSVMISFTLKNTPLKGATTYDATKLNGHKFEIDGVINQTCVYVSYSGMSHCITSGVGQLYIRCAVYDTNVSRVIFSGTFGFINNNTDWGLQEVTYGRFDYLL